MKIVKWERLPGQKNRAGHTATVVAKKIIAFGGRNGEVFCNDLWEFDMENESWIQLQEHAPVAPRAYHSATLVGKNQLWIIGGSDSREMHGDVHVLNTDTLEWSARVLNSNFVPRGTHSAVPHPMKTSSILIFGGYGGPLGKSNWLGDLVVLDTVTLKLEHLKPGGPLPAARGYHTFTAFGHSVLLYGGKNENGMIQDQVASVYHAAENKWFTPEFAGEKPGPRSNHAATVLDNSNVVLHGGRSGQSRLNDLFVLEVSGSVYHWQKYTSTLVENKVKLLKMIDSSDGPEGRAAHCLVAAESSLYMIGGYGGEGRTFSDMHVARRFPFRRKNTKSKSQNVSFVSLPLDEAKDDEGWLSTRVKKKKNSSNFENGAPVSIAEEVGTSDPFQWTPENTAEKGMQNHGDLSAKKSSTKRKAHEEFSKEVEVLRKQNAALEKEVASAKASKASNAKVLIEFEAAQAERKKLRKDLDSLQKQMEEERSKASFLQRQFDDRVAATEKSDIILEQVREELQSKTLALELKEKEKQEALFQLRSAKQAVNDRESSLERAKGLLEDATLERDEYKDCVQKLEVEIQKQMQTMQQTKSKYDAERSFMLQEITERKGTADRIFTELGISKESCRAMQEHVQQLSKQLEKANQKLDHQQQEKDELNRFNGELTAELRQMTAAKDGAEANLKLLKTELVSARTLIERNDSELAKMKENAEEAAAHIATLHASLKKAQEEAQLKLADNERLRKHIQDLEEFEQAQIRVLQAHIEKLQCARQSCPGDMFVRS